MRLQRTSVDVGSRIKRAPVSEPVHCSFAAP
jgi:hypothetical protein